MILVKDFLKKAGLEFKIILQVHDEILIEVLEKDSLLGKNIVKKAMENAFKLKLPLVCSLESKRVGTLLKNL